MSWLIGVRRLAAGFAVSFLLASCALFPTKHTLQADSSFEAHGRISVHYHDFASGKEETEFGRFDWIEHGNVVDLTLLDPLGQGIATVHAEPHAATLKLANGQQYRGSSADDLTQNALGYTVPIEGLRGWLTGKPSIAGDAMTLDADGGMTLRESGWMVHYPSASMPPKRIDLTFPGPGVALDIRLALEESN
jgi:outer membrane lipoprotein LolB